MQSINEILPKAQRTVSAAMPSKANAEIVVSIPPLSSTVVRNLWVRFAEIYGRTWTNSFGEDPDGGAAETWAKGLAGLTNEQLADGLRACVRRPNDFPPSLSTFNMLCRGIPSLFEVKKQLAPGSGHVSGFARLVWQHADHYRLKHESAEKSDRLLRDAYDYAYELVLKGEPLPEPVAALEAPKDEPQEVRPSSSEFVRKVAQEVAELLEIPPRDGRMA